MWGRNWTGYWKLSLVHFKNREKSDQLIRECAYYIWEKRIKAGLPGDELSDWLQAENKLKQDNPFLFFHRNNFTAHRSKRDPSGISTCPICCTANGSSGQPVPVGYIQCICCGDILEIYE